MHLSDVEMVNLLDQVFNSKITVVSIDKQQTLKMSQIEIKETHIEIEDLQTYFLGMPERKISSVFPTIRDNSSRRIA